MKKVIVTGASSFIGAVLSRKLLDKGYFVFAVVRFGSKNIDKIPIHPNLKILNADLSGIYILLKGNLKIDAFFHFGWDGLGSVGRNDKDIQNQNVNNALKAIEVANCMGCKCFIFAGSQAEYGIINGLITEDTPCKPLIEYGKAKLEVFLNGRIRCLELGIKYLHPRIFSVYGERDHEWTLISEVISKLLKNENVILSQCNQYWNYIYVSDAVEQIIELTEFVAISEDKKIEIYNIASDDTRILRDFTEEISKIINSDGKLLYGELSTFQVLSLQPDISKLKSDIKWKAKVSFEQGIKSIIKSIKNEKSFK